MGDNEIVELYLCRDEAAVLHTSEKYGNRLRNLAYGIINDRQTAEECENGRSISFTATSDALGIYNSVFCIMENGYIWTNVFDYAYIFWIGREAAEQIFSYVAENRIESEPEPYTFSLAGTLTEITDQYILVDDTILCADEEEGMSFKIYLDDVRISRSIEFEGITVGEIVVVSFTGDINVEEGNVLL